MTPSLAGTVFSNGESLNRELVAQVPPPEPLAEKLYGLEKAATWKAKLEQSAPVQAITQIRVKPNPTFAAGLKKPAAASLSEMATPAVIQ